MDTAEKREQQQATHRERSQLLIPRKAPWVPASANQNSSQLVYDSLKECLLRIRRESLSARDLAFEVKEFFDVLVRNETGLTSARRGLSLALDKLCADRAWTSMIQGVMRWADKTVANRSTNQFIDQVEVQSDLEYILDWYSMRSLSLVKLLTRSSQGSNYDQLFQLDVFHDQYQQNTHGFRVQTGMALFGRANQNLWLKVFVILDGEYVLPRPGWDSWIDDTELFTVPSDGEPTCFSALVPIIPDTQRTIIDNIQVFIPYAVLDIPPGKQEVEIETSLFDEKGERLLRATTREVISVAQYYEATHKMLSCQALGLWPQEAVHGYGISNLSSQVDKGKESGQEKYNIRLTADLELLGQVGDDYHLEIRCSHLDGELITKRSKSTSAVTSIERVNIPLTRPVMTLHDYNFSVPLDNLDLDGHEGEISVEVCLLNANERVLCGAITIVNIRPKIRSQIQLAHEQKRFELRGFIKRYLGF